MQATAELNYRMNIAGQTFGALFGDDLGSIIPIFPTRVRAPLIFAPKFAPKFSLKASPLKSLSSLLGLWAGSKQALRSAVPARRTHKQGEAGCC